MQLFLNCKYYPLFVRQITLQMMGFIVLAGQALLFAIAQKVTKKAKLLTTNWRI